MNYHYTDSLIIAEDLTNKIDKIIEESHKDGREAGKSDLIDVLDRIKAEITADKKKWWYGVNNDCFMKLSDVLSIIDKYRKAGE